MLAIAGGILIAVLVLGLITGGFGMIGEDEKGCGCVLLVVAAIILAVIFL